MVILSEDRNMKLGISKFKLQHVFAMSNPVLTDLLMKIDNIGIMSQILIIK